MKPRGKEKETGERRKEKAIAKRKKIWVSQELLLVEEGYWVHMEGFEEGRYGPPVLCLHIIRTLMWHFVLLSGMTKTCQPHGITKSQ